jgi:hypothetical protein
MHAEVRVSLGGHVLGSGPRSPAVTLRSFPPKRPSRSRPKHDCRGVAWLLSTCQHPHRMPPSHSVPHPVFGAAQRALGGAQQPESVFAILLSER